MAICFPSSAPTAWGTDIPFCYVLLLHPIPPLRTTRAIQIFVLEFSKDGLADLGHKFADGGSTNQPVMLQGVGLSCGQVSQDYCQFQSNFQWFPEIGDLLLNVVVDVFFDKVKKAGDSLTKF